MMADKPDPVTPTKEEAAEKVEDTVSQPDTGVDDNEEDEEPEIVTMMDVLKEEEELEENADAVLGNADDTKCTIGQSGPVKRQALYACKTCADSSGVCKAGICFACSLKCHEDHELYELYTKRSFQCDCGDPTRFPGRECQLESGHDRANVANVYNHNFEGKYCTCHRPYPDPEDTIEDSMIQCIVCEDWFHGRHLIGHVPDDQDFAEMICQQCMAEVPFLWFYYEKPASKRVKHDEPGVPGEEQEVDKESEGDASGSCELVRRKQSRASSSGTGSQGTGATFWPQGWRSALCKCHKCEQMYSEKKCAFLTDPEDTVHFYEEEGRKRTRCASSCSTSSMERGMRAFTQMPQMQQIEMLHGYNDLKSALETFLKSFADQGQVVTKEDISRFFDDFKKQKASQAKTAVFENCR